MPAPSIGLALIARDEEAALPHLLGSVAGAFDQVALLDTGSTDRTVEVFEEWAAGEQLPLGHRVGCFEWCDNFAAARNAADELLSTDWLAWADCDDRIVGAMNLRLMAAKAPLTFAGIACSYVLGADEIGLRFKMHRPRLVRRGAGRWSGRVHERLDVDGRTANVPPSLCEWRHRRRLGPTDSRRNMAIAERWAEEEADNPRALATLATEEMMRSEDEPAALPRAVRILHRLHELPAVQAELSPAELIAASWAADGLLLGVAPALGAAVGHPDLLFRLALARPPWFWRDAGQAQDRPVEVAHVG